MSSDRRIRPGSGRGRPGITLAELLVVLSLLGILAAIGLPSLKKAQLRAQAGRVAGEFSSIRSAGHQYHSERGRWPEEGEPGVVPAELAPYLNEDAFRGPGYTMQWHHWSAPEGRLVGVSVIPESEELEAAILNVVGTGPHTLRYNDRFIYFIASPFSAIPGSGGSDGGSDGSGESAEGDGSSGNGGGNGDSGGGRGVGSGGSAPGNSGGPPGRGPGGEGPPGQGGNGNGRGNGNGN